MSAPPVSGPAALGPPPAGPSAAAVLLAVFVIATCGLIYELIAGTVASYLLGDSVTQFSTVIGVYLFAMGIGSWLSGSVDRGLVRRFIEIEIAVALVGGVSAALLFFAFAHLAWFRVLLYGLVLVIGALVGLEIPLLMRILKDRYDLRDLVARVLTADYLGALLASLAFPLFLMPRLGLVRGAFFVGVLNAIVALACTYLLRSGLTRPRQALFLRVEAGLVLALLTAGLVFGDELTGAAEEGLYQDPVVFAESSPHQRVVVTEGRGGFQLYINGNLQFASMDEHRYHEALVHPALAVARTSSAGQGGALSVLVMGGGDGLALRELLGHRDVESVTLVDLDPLMTRLGRELPLLVRQNRGALRDPRVQVVNEDAFTWVAREVETGRRFEVVIADFPDPTSFSLGKLYSTRFYRLVRRALAPGGVLAVQSTSPLLARRSYWCIASTLEESGFFVRGYHASVPSFGEWGYFLAAAAPFEVPSLLPPKPQLGFLTGEVMRAMFTFPKDMDRVEAGANSLNNQILVSYYEAEWSRWN